MKKHHILILLIAISLSIAPRPGVAAENPGSPPIDPKYVVAVSRWGGDAGWVIPGICRSPGQHFLLRPDINPSEVPIRSPTDGRIVSVNEFILGGRNISIEKVQENCVLRADIVGVEPLENVGANTLVREGEIIAHASDDTLYPGLYVARDCGNGWEWIPAPQALPGVLDQYKRLAGGNWNPIAGAYARKGGSCGGPGYLLAPSTTDSWIILRQTSSTNAILVPLSGGRYVPLEPAPYAYVKNVSTIDWCRARLLEWFNTT